MKNKNIISLIICSLVLYGCFSGSKYHEDLVCVHITDRNGVSEVISSTERLKNYSNANFLSPQPYKKVVRVYGKDESGKSLSKITSYHSNGQLAQYLEAVDARAYGVYKQWHENGILAIDADVIGGPADLNDIAQKEWLFDGLCKAWDLDGNLVSKILYEKGKLQGQSYYYHPNGQIKKILPYKDNFIEGEVLEYSEENDLIGCSNYTKGKKEGISQFFYNGKELYSEKYKNGLLIEGNYYDILGNQISEIKNGDGKKALYEENNISKLLSFRKGYQEGLIECFSNDHQIVNTYHLKEGKKQGEEIFYYSNANRTPKLIINWKDNLIHGIMKTWHENGMQQNQTEYSNNKKNGVSCAWYIDGSVMLVEEYENDKLIKGLYYKINDSEPISSISEGNGVAYIYDEQGVFIRKTKYIKGFPEGNES
jgi:antitoxin component YwqK of YwqJK toxin-antitoxin module